MSTIRELVLVVKLEIHFSVKQCIRQVHYGNKRKCTLCILYSSIIYFFLRYEDLKVLYTNI